MRQKMQLGSHQGRQVLIHGRVRWILLSIFLIGAVIGFVFWPSKLFRLPNVATIPASLPSDAKPELQNGVSVVLMPERESVVPLSTSKRSTIFVIVPKGAVKQPVKIALIPYASDATRNPIGIHIAPETVKFEKPVTIRFDLTHTKARFMAPASPEGIGRTTGQTGVYHTVSQGTDTVLTLVLRSLETDVRLTTLVARGGYYRVVSDEAVLRRTAEQTLASSKSGRLSTIEAAGVLKKSAHTFSQAESQKVDRAIESLLAGADPGDLYFVPTRQLKNSLKKPSANLMLPTVYADSLGRDFLKSRCGSPSAGEYELWTLADTAQMEGFKDVEETCRKRARSIVREETDKMLAEENPDILSLIHQYQKCAEFKFTNGYLSKVQDKIDQAAIANAEKDIKEFKKKDPKTRQELEQALDALKKKIQQAQAAGEVPQSVLDQMLELSGQWAFQRAELIANDPRSTPDDVKDAVAQAMTRMTTKDQETALGQMMNKRLSRSPQEIANNPYSTHAEVVAALEEHRGKLDEDTLGKLEAKKREFWKKKEEELKKQWITPTPIPTGYIEPSVDLGIVGPLILKGVFGLESYTQSGVNDLADRMQEYADDTIKYNKEFCDEGDKMLAEYGSDGITPEALSAYQKACADTRSGSAEDDLDELIDEIREEGETINENQDRYEEESQKENPDHIEIEFTPTIAPENGATDSTPEDGEDPEEQHIVQYE